MERINKIRLLLKEKGADAALLTSDTSLLYFSGFTGGEAYILITKKEEYIVTDSRYTLQVKEECGNFKYIEGSCSDFSFIKPIISKDNIKKIAFEDEALSVSLFEEIKSILTDVDFVPLKNEIRIIRQTKSKDEVKKITQALRLAEFALSKTVPQIKAGMTEVEVAAILEGYMRKEGAEKTSFETICASGIRSALPHGTASNKIIEKGDFITLDFGCILDGYCSDITRTFVMGKADEKQKEIYSVVLSAQLGAEKEIKSGAFAKEIDLVARDIITSAGYGKNFGHSLGHGVGMEVHELPNLSPRSKAILKDGDIVTVEPGIYIEKFGGVRIEDMVYIGEENIKILTEYPKELIEL